MRFFRPNIFSIRLTGLLFVLLLLTLTIGAGHAAVGPSPAEVQGEATSGDVGLLVLFIVLALAFSFLCSVAEAVLLSITPAYIGGLKEKNPQRAALLKSLKQDNVDRSLAAILTLNTIAHTVGAIGAGAQATIVFGNTWFGVFSAAMTLAILFLSEIIPKTLGAVYWHRLTSVTAHFVRGLIFILYPLIFISELLTKLIAHGKHVHVFSRDEFLAMADIGREHGHINEHESRIIRSLFRSEKLVAEDIMTPRTVIVGFAEERTINDVLENCPDLQFSRLPIYQGSIDDVSGMILKDDLLLAKAQGRGEEALASLKRDLPTVTGEMPLSALLEFFLDNRQHIALIAGEYGGTKGIVTLEDVVETLLGMEIMDESDKVEDLQALARQQWTKRAKALGLPIEDLQPEAAGPSPPVQNS